MSKARFWLSWCIFMAACLGAGISFGAELPEAPLPPQESEIAPAEPPPAAQPARKRARQRGAFHRSQDARVEFGTDVVIGPDEEVRELVVIGGNVTVNGMVDGSLVVISGSARVNGHVNHELVTVLGSAVLGPEGSVGRDAVVIGGTFQVDPGAFVGGQQTVIALGGALPDFQWLQQWLSSGLLLARPFPPRLQWVWVVAGVLLLLYLGLTLAFPRPVHACVGALEEQPVASFFVGILILVLFGPLVFLLVISVAGILVIPFIVAAFIVAAVLGKAAVYSYAGQQIGRQIHCENLGLPVMLLVGAALFYLVYMIPVLGFAMWGVVTLVGLGAVLLAAFGSFHRGEELVAVRTQPAAGLLPAGAEGASGSAAAPGVMLGPDVALLPRVGFWRRFCATMLDFLLLGLLIPAIGPFFLALWAGYYVAMWIWKGTSIGGIVMGIKVVRVDGQPVNFAVALVRSLSSFFSAFALFLGFFWAGWDREKQAWHDKIAGTVVVKVPRGMSLI